MPLEIGVFGAGAIGCFLGLHLSASGARVTLLGRSSAAALSGARARLRAVPLARGDVRPDPALVITDDPAALSRCDVVLLTVKSQDTEAAARVLARELTSATPVVSFQNGIRNAAILRAHLATEQVVPGMVSFNVRRDDAAYVQRTRGPVIAGAGRGEVARLMRSLTSLFAASGLPVLLRADIDDVLAGKLLLNLNNGVCAATGLPIAASLRSRDARRCLSRCMREGLRALQRAGLRPKSVIGMPPWVIARFLPLPDAIVLPLTRKLVSADPEARSSTLMDLDAGKPTEIDFINGSVVEIAARHGLAAPANQLITALVHELEGQRAPAFVSADELRRRIDAL